MLSKEDKIKILEVNINAKKIMIKNLHEISLRADDFIVSEDKEFAKMYRKDCEYIIEVLEKEISDLKKGG